VKGVILAAGEGTRLRPLTLDRPKPMLPIAGKPLLEHIISWLRRYGVTDLAINLHHRPDAIRNYFGSGRPWRVTIHYAREPTLLGTAGALRNFTEFLDETFVLVYGDVLTNMPLDELVIIHRVHLTQDPRTLMTLALYRVPNPTECGIVQTDPRGRITRFQEKPPPDRVFSNLASAGVMIIEPSVMELIPPGRPVDFGFHVIPEALRRSYSMYGWVIPPVTYLIDIGTPEKYAQVQVDWPRVQEEERA